MSLGARIVLCRSRRGVELAEVPAGRPAWTTRGGRSSRVKRVQLWAVEEGGQESAIRAVPVTEVADTETERRLENLLVSAPKSLLDGITLIGRQFRTAGGPVDLLGVDQEGRLVVLELKRGTLTREAVAQILDYASDLSAMEDDQFARLIEQYSGRGGVDEIEDFSDWYNREFPNADSLLSEPPRMVLVGVGADATSMRVVDFLAKAGIDIQLLTFHAFRSDGKLMLARQVETAAPARRAGSSSQTKQGNRKELLELAEGVGSKALLLEVADFLENRMECYRWPGKTAFSFSLQGQTDEGKPSLHSYATLRVDRNRKGTLILSFHPRAEAAAPEASEQFLQEVPSAQRRNSSWIALEVAIREATWPELRPALEQVVNAIVEGWRKGEALAESTTNGADPEQEPTP